MRRTPATVLLAVTLMERPDEEHYGYDLMKITGTPSGVLYLILQRMQEHGWVQRRWDLSDERPPRRYYRLTDKGQSEIGNWKYRNGPAHRRPRGAGP